MDKLRKMYFSQSAMELFDTCKLKFKKIYLENIHWSDEERNFGSLFHLLAHRYYLGIDEVIDNNKEEYVLLENLKKFLKRDTNRKPEYVIRYKEESFRLLAKMDLLVKEKDTIILYDWKTNKSSFEETKIKNTYQTKIYLHNVVEKFKISPNKVKLIYYNPRLNKFLEISYDEKKHENYKLELKNKVIEILKEEKFDEKIGKHCSVCQFNSICNKKWITIDALLV